jgi:hypothetical protein
MTVASASSTGTWSTAPIPPSTPSIGAPGTPAPNVGSGSAMRFAPKNADCLDPASQSDAQSEVSALACKAQVSIDRVNRLIDLVNDKDNPNRRADFKELEKAKSDMDWINGELWSRINRTDTQRQVFLKILISPLLKINYADVTILHGKIREIEAIRPRYDAIRVDAIKAKWIPASKPEDPMRPNPPPR